MSKNRYVDTRFWDDEYIAERDPIEKLLFLYFLTNPLTNICGIYEIMLKRVAFDTGIDKDMIIKILERFEKDGKIKYDGGWIAISNFIKHQKLNPSIEKGIEKELQKAPKYLIEWINRQAVTGCHIALLNSNSNLDSNSDCVKKVDIEIINKIYDSYPPRCPISNRSTGKCSKNKDKIKALLNGGLDTQILLDIIAVYIRDCANTKTYVKNFATFLNNLPDIEELKKQVKKVRESDTEYFNRQGNACSIVKENITPLTQEEKKAAANIASDLLTKLKNR